MSVIKDALYCEFLLVVLLSSLLYTFPVLFYVILCAKAAKLKKATIVVRDMASDGSDWKATFTFSCYFLLSS